MKVLSMPSRLAGGRLVTLSLTERQKSALCVAGLGLLPWVLFWRVAAFLDIPSLGDIISSGYPFQYYMQAQLRQGQLPLWNDRILAGVPFGSFYSTLYPTNVLLAFLPAWLVMGWSVLLHFGLVGIFTYLYLRSLHVSRKGAVLSGIVFMLCGFVMGHTGHASVNRTLPWLPLILWAIEGWRQHLHWRYPAIGALAVGLLFLGGHPQSPIYAMYIAGLYLLYVTLRPTDRGARLRVLVGGAAMFAVGLIIASPVLWDLYQMTKAGGRGIPPELAYAYFSAGSIQPRYMANLLLPVWFHGQVDISEVGGYIGILPWALALLAVRFWRQHARWFWLGVALVTVTLPMGSNLPTFRLFFHIPVFNSLRIPPRNWFEFDFAMAVLAGMGFDVLFVSAGPLVQRIVAWARGAAVGLVLAGVGCVAAVRLLFGQPIYDTLRQSGYHGYFDHYVWLPLFMIPLSAVALWVVARRRAAWWSAVLVLGLIGGDLYFSIARFNVERLVAAHSVSQAFAEAFPPDRMTTLAALPHDRSDYRVLTYTPSIHWNLDDEYDLLTPDLNMLFGVSSVDGYVGGLLAKQFRDFVDNTIQGDLAAVFVTPRIFQPDHHDILNLLNLRYIITPVSPSVCCYATKQVDGIRFDTGGYPSLDLGRATGLMSTTLEMPAGPATTVALVAALQGGQDVPQGQQVARVTATARDGRTSTFYLTAGENIAEWRYDCPDVKAQHSMTQVALDDPQGGCMLHWYLAAFPVSEVATPLRSVTIEYLLDTAQLSVSKVSLYDAHSQKSQTVSATRGYLAYLTPANHYRQIYQDAKVRIYENDDALPRAFLTPTALRVESATQADQIVLQGRLPDGTAFEPRRVALVDNAGLPASVAPAGDSAAALGAGDNVHILTQVAGRVELQSNAESPAFLVYSQNYDADWRALLDGRPASLYRTDGTLMGVVVPPGQHRITLVYRPLTRYLAGASYATMLLIIGGLVLSRLRVGRRRPVPPVASPDDTNRRA
jgi:hypothetical protein